MTGPVWKVEHHVGSAAAFHERDVPDPAVHALWWFEVDRPALVLGSTQPAGVVDAGAAAAAGTDVAKRRSGGGAVHLAAGEATWIDVILPVDDPRWTIDVGRSFDWLGRAWVEVLGALGHPGATVHDGPLVRRTWSDLVCFGGVGPGEVLLGGRKVVGISQRRTRTAARFQCALLHRWDPAAVASLLALTGEQRAEATADLLPLAAGIGDAPPEEVVELLLGAVQAGSG